MGSEIIYKMEKQNDSDDSIEKNIIDEFEKMRVTLSTGNRWDTIRNNMINASVRKLLNLLETTEKKGFIFSPKFTDELTTKLRDSVWTNHSTAFFEFLAYHAQITDLLLDSLLEKRLFTTILNLINLNKNKNITIPKCINKLYNTFSNIKEAIPLRLALCTQEIALPSAKDINYLASYTENSPIISCIYKKGICISDEASNLITKNCTTETFMETVINNQNIIKTIKHLELACVSGNIAKIKALLDCKICPNQTCFRSVCVKSIAPRLVDMLIDYGYKLNYEDLLFSIEKHAYINNIELYDFKFDDKYMETCAKADYFPYNIGLQKTSVCLEIACLKNKTLSDIKKLVKEGVKPTPKALSNACVNYTKNKKVIEYLLDIGVVPDLECFNNIGVCIKLPTLQKMAKLYGDSFLPKTDPVVDGNVVNDVNDVNDAPIIVKPKIKSTKSTKSTKSVKPVKSDKSVKLVKSVEPVELVEPDEPDELYEI